MPRHDDALEEHQRPGGDGPCEGVNCSAAVSFSEGGPGTLADWRQDR
jgi:hypothetical protein